MSVKRVKPHTSKIDPGRRFDAVVVVPVALAFIEFGDLRGEPINPLALHIDVMPSS